jgi:hypothetical protein
MLSATFTSTALRVARGMNFASGAAARMMIKSVTGVDHSGNRRPGPAFDVRGRAGDGAGAAMPPKSGLAMLAIPAPSTPDSNRAGRQSCHPTTTAQSSDSMAASSAMVVAG